MQIRPVSDLRNKFPEIEKYVENGEPVYLTKNGYGSMVVISIEQYEKLTQRAELISEFEMLVGYAKGEIRIHPDAELVVVVRTKKNLVRTYGAKLEDLEEATEEFIQELLGADDTQIKYMVCMWNSYSLDIPGHYLRKRLLEIDPRNAETRLILESEYDFAVRTIESIMPPKAQKGVTMKFVIISGGHIDDVFAVDWLKKNKYDCMIAADSGMDFLYRNEIVPDIIAGDFDSAKEESVAYFQGMNSVQVLKLNPIKDDTDTEFVIREAVRRGATEITLLGATGTRLDHVLANVNLLGIGVEEGVSIRLVDKYNHIRMTDACIEIKKSNQFGDYVSVLPVKGDAKGVTLEGMRYSLQDADIACFSSLGVSNEIVEDTAKISVKQGTLLVIESRDQIL